MNTFFAAMHDRLVPHYIRLIVDAIEVDIGADQFAAKLQHPSFRMTTTNNSVNVPQQEERDEEENREKLTPEHFVMNFLQMMTRPLPKAIFRFPEAKQRAVVFAILNSDASGALDFPMFWNLFK